MKNKIMERCNICRGEALVDKTEQVLLINGAIDEVQSRRCFLCKNLLYARIRRIQAPTVKLEGDSYGK